MGHVGSTQFDSTIVALETDEGVTGWGEIAVISAVYGDSFAAGARAGIAELAPLLLGADPTQPRLLYARLDGAMRGQPYVKSPLDMAAWDATARAAGKPLCEALGARFGDAVPLYDVVTVLPLEEAVALARELVADGYRRIQVKVGTTPAADAERLAAVRDAVGSEVVLYADANGAFTASAARTFLRAHTRPRVRPRAALPHLRRVRVRPPRDRPAARPRRVDRHPRRPAPRAPRTRRRRDHDQAAAGGRDHQSGAHARRRRRARGSR